MKKSIFYSSLIIVYMLLNSLVTKIYAQTNKLVTISISGIENKDTNFITLREALKNNKKLKAVAARSSSGVINLVFSYFGDPEDLWDEVPKSSKQFFKLISIDEVEGADLIKLAYTKQKSSSSGTDKIVVKNNINKKNCFDCDYFPMCTYDVTKSYNGRIFRGIRSDDNSITYYYCNNGELIKRWDYTKKITRKEFSEGTWDDYITTYEDYENKTASLTILKANAAIGTSWTEQISDDGPEYVFIIDAKGIKFTYDGKMYNDVIKVRFYTKGVLINHYYYYAKNIGYLGKDLIDDNYKKLGNRAIKAAFTSWGGTWKMTKNQNGKIFSADEPTEYMQILDDGTGATFKLQKKADGKLHLASMGFPLTWSVWTEKSDTVVYIKRSWIHTDNGEPIDKSSIPLKLLLIGGQTYEYYGDDIQFDDK